MTWAVEDRVNMVLKKVGSVNLTNFVSKYKYITVLQKSSSTIFCKNIEKRITLFLPTY
jgi:hypothetical protein